MTGLTCSEVSLRSLHVCSCFLFGCITACNQVQFNKLPDCEMKDSTSNRRSFLLTLKLEFQSRSNFLFFSFFFSKPAPKVFTTFDVRWAEEEECNMNEKEFDVTYGTMNVFVFFFIFRFSLAVPTLMQRATRLAMFSWQLPSSPWKMRVPYCSTWTERRQTAGC